ncbi:hypothetical protein HOD83_03615 [Candidatus Woesearchaeota archaeon]|jgi:hypothetical protein|nr:hypothetical protein [Candidatus Woesearchaeota archaeon]MBT4248643.1 hypothetical protein [Candidatus Woesearchaeota archaeon]
MKITLVPLIVLIFLLLPLASSSIGPGAIMSGDVKHPDGSAAGSVAVQVTDQTNSYSRSTSTNANGKWATAFSFTAGDTIYVYAANDTHYGNVTTTVGSNLTVVLADLIIVPVVPGTSTGSVGNTAGSNTYVVDGYVFIDNERAPTDVKVDISNVNTGFGWVTYTVASDEYTNYFSKLISASAGDMLSVKATYEGYSVTIDSVAISTTPHPVFNLYINTDRPKTDEEVADEKIAKEEEKKNRFESLDFDLDLELEGSSKYIVLAAVFSIVIISAAAYYSKFYKKKKKKHTRRYASYYP